MVVSNHLVCQQEESSASSASDWPSEPVAEEPKVFYKNRKPKILKTDLDELDKMINLPKNFEDLSLINDPDEDESENMNDPDEDESNVTQSDENEERSNKGK